MVEDLNTNCKVIALISPSDWQRKHTVGSGNLLIYVPQKNVSVGRSVGRSRLKSGKAAAAAHRKFARQDLEERPPARTAEFLRRCALHVGKIYQPRFIMYYRIRHCWAALGRTSSQARITLKKLNRTARSRGLAQLKSTKANNPAIVVVGLYLRDHLAWHEHVCFILLNPLEIVKVTQW